MGKGFKEELLNNLGGDIRCFSSSYLGRRISTFLISQISTKRHNSAIKPFSAQINKIINNSSTNNKPKVNYSNNNKDPQ
jgi:hypothetical protein